VYVVSVGVCIKDKVAYSQFILIVNESVLLLENPPDNLIVFVSDPSPPPGERESVTIVVNGWAPQ
jgi:hypothetical protein